jgi:hypothetical protein
MTYIKAFLGYGVAVFCIVFAMATFVTNGQLGRTIVKSAGLSISPWLIGGKSIRTIDHGEYQTVIHAPVFKGLIFGRRNGFIQIDWLQKTGFPAIITENIDYDNDGQTDFNITFEHQQEGGPEIVSPSHYLLPRLDLFKRDRGLTIRIWMKR